MVKTGDSVPDSNFVPKLTEDGSFTFFSTEFDEAFHSKEGAYQEAQCKFVDPTCLAQKAQQPLVRVLDICYGLGYNTATALSTIWAINPSCRIEWIGLELNIAVPKAAIDHQLLVAWDQPIRQLLTDLAAFRCVTTERFTAQLLIGDARQLISQVGQLRFLADAIFLDPFSPPHCPQLWTIEFLAQVAACLHPTGRLTTYSCAASVRTALLAAGLQIGATPRVGRRSPGTIASFMAAVPPLSLQEQEHLATRAAIPYRDPALVDSALTIWQRREQEQQNCLLEPTSRWRKRWLRKLT